MRIGMITMILIAILLVIPLASHVCESNYTFKRAPTFSSREINLTSIATPDMVEIADVTDKWADNEVVFTGLGFGVVCVYGCSDNWSKEYLWQRPYDVDYTPRLAVGDLDPDIEGNEIVEGFFQLYLVTYENTSGNWSGTLLWDTYNETGGSVVHAIKIGDFDPTHPGNELVVHGGNELREYYKDGNGTWANKSLDTGEVSIELGVGDVTPVYSGNEIVCFTTTNITILGWNSSSNWWDKMKVIIVEDAIWWDDGMCTAGRVGELNTSNDVAEIVCGEKGSRLLILIWWNGTAFERRTIYWLGIGTGEGLEFSSIGIGDCWSGHEGNEVLAGTYWGNPSRVVLLWEENGEWKKSVVFYCPQYRHPYDIEVGEFDITHASNEVVIGSGVLFEIYEDTSVDETGLFGGNYAVGGIIATVVIIGLNGRRGRKYVVGGFCRE